MPELSIGQGTGTEVRIPGFGKVGVLAEARFRAGAALRGDRAKGVPGQVGAERRANSRHDQAPLLIALPDRDEHARERFGAPLCLPARAQVAGRGGRMRMAWPAALVHLFTALGAVCALLATRAVLAGAWEEVFAWLGLALIIDGIDGTFARMADVTDQASPFLRRAARSGRRLCDLCVRAGAGAVAGGLSCGGGSGWCWRASSCCPRCFIFPTPRARPRTIASSAFRPSGTSSPSTFSPSTCRLGRRQCVVLACVVLTFVPMRWAHPLRTPLLWPVTLAADGRVDVWPPVSRSGRAFPPARPRKAILLLVAAYGVGLALCAQPARRRRRPAWLALLPLEPAIPHVALQRVARHARGHAVLAGHSARPGGHAAR